MNPVAERWAVFRAAMVLPDLEIHCGATQTLALEREVTPCVSIEVMERRNGYTCKRETVKRFKEKATCSTCGTEFMRLRSRHGAYLTDAPDQCCNKPLAYVVEMEGRPVQGYRWKRKRSRRAAEVQRGVK